MYRLVDFGDMIADEARMKPYAEAIRRAVRPGAVVVDVGAGTGIMTLLACQRGARHVYAVEPSSAGQLVLQAARDNGFGDRVTLLQKRSTDVTLPELADVMVSDMRGVLPALSTHLADIVDARARLLSPSGTQIPARDRLFVAAVQAEQVVSDQRRIWQSAPFGLELGSALRHVENHWAKHRAAPEALLCEPACWAELDYTTLRDPHVRGESTLEITRAGTAHGLLLWFDTILIDEVGFSNAPGAPRAIYGQQLLPWPTPLALEPGDRLHVELRADQVGTDYRWSWFTEHLRAAQPRQVVTRFRQSDFLATPISPELLRKRADDFAPKLSPNGELALRILERMRAGATLGTIAAELHSLAPGRFASELDALDFAADLAERHGL